MNSQTTISEADLVSRFNAELQARADPKRLQANRSTSLGNFVMQAPGGPRLWLRDHEVEWIARRQGILLANEAVKFDWAPSAGRAYAPT
jgi:hypothetical protein